MSEEKKRGSLGQYISELVHKEVGAATLDLNVDGDPELPVVELLDEVIAAGARAVAVLAASRLHQNNIQASADEVLATAEKFAGYILGHDEEGA